LWDAPNYTVGDGVPDYSVQTTKWNVENKDWLTDDSNKMFYNVCRKQKGLIMNLERDLQKLRKEKQMKESAVAQLRKRSKDSIARPKAEKNILSTDPRMQRI
jgi:hypothetical protein